MRTSGYVSRSFSMFPLSGCIVSRAGKLILNRGYIRDDKPMLALVGLGDVDGFHRMLLSWVSVDHLASTGNPVCSLGVQQVLVILLRKMVHLRDAPDDESR